MSTGIGLSLDSRRLIPKSFIVGGKLKMMKRYCFLVVILVLLFPAMCAFADPMGDLLDQFGKEYEAVIPRSQYSSVGTDYKLTQAALGTYYTTRSLSLLYSQNEQMMDKYDELLAKYDQVIEQNREIIRLLSQIAKKGVTPGRPEETPGESR
jgi:hypothetical protein